MSAVRKSPTTTPTARPALARIEPLEHGGPGAFGEASLPLRADFSTGVNAFGPATVVLDAVREADPASYPDPACRLARRAASAWSGRDDQEIVIGAGSVELIYAAASAFIRPGDLVLIPEPGFSEYQRAARLAGARVSTVHFAGDADARREHVESFCRVVVRQRPRMAFLASPESATGALFEREWLRQIADACQLVGTLLVLDQGYDAFTRHPFGTPALPGHAAVLHLRSLTKDHALAGIRVGLGIGPVAVIDAINRVRPPWAVSSPAQAAVVAACTDEAQRHVRDSIAALLTEAAALAGACAGVGSTPVRTATHYFLVDVGDGDRIARMLLHEHVIRVRSAGSFGFPRCIRVAARRPEENALLLQALRPVAAAPFTEPRHVRSY